MSRPSAWPTRPPPNSPNASSKSAVAPHEPELTKVFFSDDGSTAMEVALKLAYEFTRRRDRASKPRFLSMAGAYHGDTVGAVSLGHIDLFHRAYAGLLFKSDQVMAPYCYRCPFNRAQPERARRPRISPMPLGMRGPSRKAVRPRRQTRAPLLRLRLRTVHPGRCRNDPSAGGMAAARRRNRPRPRRALIADEVLTAFGRAVHLHPQSIQNRQTRIASHRFPQPCSLPIPKGCNPILLRSRKA
jgi:hypothetical protein